MSLKNKGPLDPFDTFLQTGKVSDYLNYVAAARGPIATGQTMNAQTTQTTGEAIAYQDTGNRPARTDG